MMGPFAALDIAATGAKMGMVWLDVLANNIANVNTTHPADQEPFRASLVVAQAREDGQGVDVVATVPTTGEPPTILDPTNPHADALGYVKRPVVDLAGQMTDLIIANRSYQANLTMIRTSREAYETALRIGR
jgi:flagellar basal-body rod protein FlgC